MSLKSFRSWSHWIALGFLVLVGLSKTPPLAAQAQTRSYPVSLELLAPTSGGNKIPTVTWGGWPLVLRMSANREIGIIRRCVPFSHTEFPVYAETGEIVFEEPDASIGSLTSSLWFTPGLQLPRGCENFPDFPPCLAGSVPSLVLLSDSGEPGINLASYVTNIGYELDDTSHRTNVVASLTAPNGFVSPSVTVDNCVGTVSAAGLCFGGPLGRLGTQTLSFPALVELLNSNNVATLRAFVVSARFNPRGFRDLDGDGVIGAKDAELAGLNLLSREVVFQVRTLHQFGELVYAPRSDLDGNGASVSVCSGCGAPAPGGGRLTPVPR